MKNIDELINKLTINEKVDLVSGYKSWMTSPIKRLDIPSIYLTDGPIGVRKKDDSASLGGLGLGKSFPSTSFPTSVNLANSFNNRLAYNMGKAIGQECEIYNVNVLLGPAMNIKRDPRCGRNFEYFSEDPLLAGLMAASYVNGVQSNNVAACLKHFAANNSENYRYMGSSILDERALHEIYLKPFEIATKIAHPKTIMCAYNQINGVPCSENKYLNVDVLRRLWGYRGLVMTDWGATKDRVKGVQAGIDLDMPGDVKYNKKQLIKAIKNKTLSIKDLDRATKNVLKLVYSFDKNKELSDKDKKAIFENNNTLALKIALESAVLLKNENNILPLNKDKKVLVVGELFEKMRYQGAGSSSMNPYKLTTVKEAFDKYNVKYEYVKGYKEIIDKEDEALVNEALLKAKNYDTILFFGGLTDLFESEGYDRKDLSLPNNQLSLISKLAKENNVITILFGGSPFEMPFVNNVKAILNMFLPGQAGGEATRKLLYGEANPSGKLSETWVKQLKDIPYFDKYSSHYLENYKENIFVGYRYYDLRKDKVLFPFGYGLSYSTFTFTHKGIKLEDNVITIKVEVTNTSNVAGSEVVQVYVGKNKNSKVFKANKELKGYEKVYLKPNESKEVSISFKRSDVSYYNNKLKKFIIENGTYPIYVGNSSADIKYELEFVIAGYKEFDQPYSNDVNKTYNDINNVDKINDEIFNETINNLKVEVPSSNPFTLETQLEEFKSSKNGLFVYNLIMKFAGGKMVDVSKIEDENERNLLIKNQKFMSDLIPKNSLRSLVQSSGGMLSMNLAKFLLELANGHKLKAIKELFK